MNRRLPMRTVACVAVLLGAASAGRAQSVDPQIGYVFPAGGQRGEIFEVLIGGQRLSGVTGAQLSGTGVHIEVLEYTKPLSRKQQNELREQLRQLKGRDRKKAGEADGDPIMWRGMNLSEMSRAELADLRKQISNKKKQRNNSLAETVRLRVEIEDGAPVSDRELRLKTPAGLSNPLRFQVDHLPERFEQEPNNHSAEAGAAVSLPVVLNGQILPGDVDRFRFSARAGQRLVARTSARALIPYLADAVPGWFQATLALFDAEGMQLAYTDDYQFHPDPVLFFEVPADGEYELEIRDSIYRGREDFVYRIALGELPFVTSSFPLGGPAGETTEVSLEGWNLPRDRLAKGGEPGGDLDSTISGAVPFEFSTLEEVREQEPNPDPESAQPLALSRIVNGRIDEPGDQDVFRIEARPGALLVAEVTARRLGSPLDSVLRLTDGQGVEIAVNDDHDDRGAGLITHQADSLLTATLENGGAYFLTVRDAQAKGGPEYAYRLRVGPPRPDFALRVVPSSINVRAGGTVPLTIYALRRDGFAGPIQLELDGAPDGFLLSGARVPAGQEQIRVTLTAPFAPSDEPFRVTLRGRARIGKEKLVHAAVAADDLMQAFLYRHLVPAEELLVSVNSTKGPRLPTRRVAGSVVTLTPGGTVELSLPAAPKLPLDRVQLELNDPPEGIRLQEVREDQGRLTLILHADAEQAKPGLEGNLILDLFIERNQQTPAKKPARNRRNPLGCLPAIRFQVLPATREV